MNLFSKIKLATLSAIVMSSAVLAPQAQAADFYRCTKSTTVTIRYDGTYYWYLQGGKVCGQRYAPNTAK